MPMYAVAVLLVLMKSDGLCKQAWLVGDPTGVGSFANERMVTSTFKSCS